VRPIRPREEREAPERKAPEREASEREASEREASARDVLDLDAVEREAVDREAVDREALDREALDWEALDWEGVSVAEEERLARRLERPMRPRSGERPDPTFWEAPRRAERPTVPPRGRFVRSGSVELTKEEEVEE
jgi:hypothetical protein